MRTGLIHITACFLLLASAASAAEAPPPEAKEAPPAEATEEENGPLLLPPFALASEFPATVLQSPEDDTLSIAPPEPADFSVIYEGNTGGLSGAAADFTVDGILAGALAASEGRVVRRVASGWGAFLQDGRWLFLQEGGVPEFRSDVAPAKQVAERGPATVPGLLADDYAVFVWPPQITSDLLSELARALSDIPRRPPPTPQDFHVTQQRTGGSEVLLVERGPRPVGISFPLEPDLWETRLRSSFAVETKGSTAYVQVISRLEGEGARRVALTEQWRQSPSIYISAGESVEGRSFLSGAEVSLQRPATWERWQELGLDALVPGELELAAGVDALIEEANQAGVQLVSANFLDQQGEPLFAPYTVKEVAGRRVALLGWTDPEIYPQLPQAARAKGTIAGVEALHDALAKIESEEVPPDLVVLFGVTAGKVAADLPGIDIVLGDFATRLRLARWESVDEAALRARSLEHPRARAAALVSRLGPHLLGRVDLAFDAQTGALRRLRHLRARIAEDQPPNQDALRAVQSVRQSVYSALSDTLIPSLDSLPQIVPKKGRPAPPADLDLAAFIRLSANLLMDRTGADLALLRPLPSVPAVPGDTAELFVDASLSVLDEVVLIELSGAELKAVLRTVRPTTPGESPPAGGGLWAWVAGAKQKGLKVTVRGRPLSDSETVLLATTDFFANDPALALALKKARVRRTFSGDGWRRWSGRLIRGETWRLHDLVKDGLVTLRSGRTTPRTEGEDPEAVWVTDPARYAAALRPLLLDQAAERSSRLRVELDGLAIQVTGSLPVGDRAEYSTATESRIHQSQAMNASARGRVALVWDDRIGSATGYFEFAFGEQQVPEVDEATELEDDLEFGVEGRIRLFSIPTKKSKISLSNFFAAALDSEFTKSEEADSVQKTLRFTSGTSLGKYRFFKELKGGFFVEYDTVSDESPVAPGLSIYAKIDKLWGPIKWTAFGDLRAYLPTDKDSAEDLSFTAQLRTDIAVLPVRKFVPGLSIGAFFDAFLFQGASEVQSDGSRAPPRAPGLHLLVGMAISYNSALSPPIRLR